MWGSYVGGILGILIGMNYFSNILFSPFILFNDKLCFSHTVGNMASIICPFSFLSPQPYNPILIFIIWIIVGFLIGWAIHSLIRKLKN